MALSTRQPWAVIAIALALTLAGLYVTVTRFALNTNTERLISADVPWRKALENYSKAFSRGRDLIVAVVEGDMPEVADEAADKLAQALAGHPGVLRSVRRPDSGPFFDKYGLLFLPLDELTRTTEQLIRQQGFLGPLAADPSLRGIMEVLQLGARGVRAGETTLDELAAPMAAFAKTFEEVLVGRPARLSWRQLLSGGNSEPRELRRFILIKPELDYEVLEPAAAAIDLIRSAAADLELTPERGVRVRLTGPAAVESDEFATFKENAALNAVLTVAAIALILFLALRSGRVILAVLATTFAGLIVATGAGLLMVGQFNPISIAFMALFLGLGIDFGIQFAVRYRAERYGQEGLRSAIIAAGRGVGWSLTLAAVSLLAGFFSFLPTEFRGVSELGLIAGAGMVIAYVASLTLLPALLSVLHPPGEPESVEAASLAVVDRWIAEHRGFVLIATAAVVLGGVPFLLMLSFDANPMNLRSQEVESVATFLDLAKDPQFTPNTIDVIAPALEAAKPLAEKLEALPEVSHTVTLTTFIPETQDEKLALIQDAAMLLDPVLHPPTVKPPPSDAENIEALRSTAAALREIAGANAGAANDMARRLANVLDRLAKANPGQRAAAQTAVTVDLVRLLDRLRTALSAETDHARNAAPRTRPRLDHVGRPRPYRGVPEGQLQRQRRHRTVRRRGARGRARGDRNPDHHRRGGSHGGARLHRGGAVLARRDLSDPLDRPASRGRCGADAGTARAGHDHDPGGGLPARPSPELRQHHRPAADVGYRRRLPHLLHRRLARRGRRHAGVKSDPCHLLQCAHHGRGIRQPVLLQPSGNGEHGQAPGLVAVLHASGGLRDRAGVPWPAAQTASRRAVRGRTGVGEIGVIGTRGGGQPQGSAPA